MSDPGQLDDDELIHKLRKDLHEARPANALEHEAPVDVEEVDAEGDSQEIT